MTQPTIDFGKDEEHQKNDHPISTREKIYAQLDTPKDFDALFAQLADPVWAKRPVYNRLSAMMRDQQLIFQNGLYQHKEPTELIKAMVGAKGSEKFVTINNIRLVLSDRHAQGLFPNDEVTVRLPVDLKPDSIPVVVSVHTNQSKRILCVVRHHRGKVKLLPFDQRIKQPLVMGRDQFYEDNTVISVIRKGKQRSKRFIEVTPETVVGSVYDAGIERIIAKATYNLADAWDESIQVEGADQATIDQVSQSREQWLDLPFVTIDGATAKDYDDAVYCEKIEEGYRLYVAIADVSYYCKPGTALDDEAKKRGNSTYLPGHVIPMLPEALSNQACSLLPNVIRLAMGCVIDIRENGERIRSRLAKVAIRSHARMEYTQVDQMIKGKEEIPDWFKESLSNLDSVAKALRAYRVNKGTIVLRSFETSFGFDDKGEIESLVQLERLWAHQLIEECMLCANTAVGQRMHEEGIPIIYRAHSEPLAEKVRVFQDYLKFHNIDLPDDPSPKDLQAVLDQCVGKPDFHAIEMMVLRTLSQAFYSAEEVSHFALSTEYYTHFTSPIRRYVDLTVHRAIDALLDGQKEQEDLGQTAQDCSVTERNADEASWFAQAWLKAKWVEQYIGKTFHGKVSAVTHFGMFVALDEIPVEGLVHISLLGDDYYTFDESNMCMSANNSNNSFMLGQQVSIIIKSVDLALQRVDFAIANKN